MKSSTNIVTSTFHPTMEINDNLLETITYNEPTTPIKAAISYLHDYPNGTMPCHWHKELECIVVLEGKLNYSVNDQTFYLKKGDGIIVNSNRLHLCGPVLDHKDSKFIVEKHDCRYLVLLLQPDSLRFNQKMEDKYINPLLYDINSAVFYLDNSREWHSLLLDSIYKIFNAVTKKTPCFELVAQSEFFVLWKNLYENTIKENGYDYSSIDPLNPLKKMMSYIQANYQKKITLNDIAQAGMMCQSKCCRLFRENLRQSPIEYLLNYRIQKGIYLLEHTKQNITEIALECGFRGSSYFTEIFRKTNGVSPTEYRKNYHMHSN